MKNGICRGRLVNERLRIICKDSAVFIEMRALGAVVAYIQEKTVRQGFLHIQIPDLHVAEAIVWIDRKIICTAPVAVPGNPLTSVRSLVFGVRTEFVCVIANGG